jgi:U3 small nucleolar RNA-associated protein 21
MLATCHVNRRGIYLWSNQAVFGGGGDIAHSDALVSVRLPALAAGHAPVRGAGMQARDAATVAATIAGQKRDSDGVRDDGNDLAAEHDNEGDGGAVGATAAMLTTLSDEDEGYTEEEEDDGVVLGDEGDEKDGGDGGAADGDQVWQATGAGGAPQPLCPSMVTLSLLPRAQWHSLLHLEAIKARNKCVAPAWCLPASCYQ